MNKLNSSKFVILLLCTSAIIIFSYFYYWNNSSNSENISVGAENIIPTVANQSQSPAKENKNETPPSPAGRSMRTAADVAEVDDWFKRNGIGPSRDSYAPYSEDELEAMLSTGDFIAGDVLTSRYFDKMDLQQAKIIAEKSLVYGSRRAAMNLYLIHHYEIPSSMDDVGTRLRKKGQLVDMFSYLELADLRGGKDLFYTEADRRAALTSFKRAYGDDEILAEEDYFVIQNKARALYEKYEKKRQELGLGEFDNELPKAVADYLK